MLSVFAGANDINIENLEISWQNVQNVQNVKIRRLQFHWKSSNNRHISRNFLTFQPFDI